MWHQLDFSMFNELCRCCLPQCSLAFRLWRPAYISRQQCGLFEVSHEISSANNSIKCYLIPVLEGSLGDKRYIICQVIWLFHLDCFLFKEASTVLGFYTTPQKALNFSYLFLHSLPIHLSFATPVPASAPPINHLELSTLFPFCKEMYLSLVPYSIPNLCGYTGCSMPIKGVSANIHI